MIREHRDSESKGVLQPDLLYTLLQVQDTEAGIGGMTDIQLRDEVMIIFLASNETTSTWTLYLLSQNPTVGDRMYDELQTALPWRYDFKFR